MLQPDEARARIVGEWVAKAERDLRLAEHLVADLPEFDDEAAFHAQQAAEKYLKALLVQQAVEFPKTHDIADLLELVATVSDALAQSLEDAEALTAHAVGPRYPRGSVEVDAERAAEALALAQRVRDAVVAALAPEPPAE